MEQVSSHLEFIWSVKLSSKWTVPKLTVIFSLDHLVSTSNFSQMAGLKLVKNFPLNNRLLKLSYKSYFIRLGPETREL